MTDPVDAAARRAANVLFNLAQVKGRELTDRERRTMATAADEVDAAFAARREAKS